MRKFIIRDIHLLSCRLMKLVKKHYSRDSPVVCNANGRDLSRTSITNTRSLKSFLWFPLFQNLSHKDSVQIIFLNPYN